MGGKYMHGDYMRQAAIGLEIEFDDSPSILQGMRTSGIPNEKMDLLVIEAITTRPKSVASAKPIAKHVKGLIQFYLDTRKEISITLTCESSMVLIRDYLESLTERGRTVPSPAKHALTVWEDAPGID